MSSINRSINQSIDRSIAGRPDSSQNHQARHHLHVSCIDPFPPSNRTSHTPTDGRTASPLTTTEAAGGPPPAAAAADPATTAVTEAHCGCLLLVWLLLLLLAAVATCCVDVGCMDEWGLCG